MNQKKIVNFRAKPVECIALKELMRVEGKCLSDVLRLAVQETAQRRGLWPVESDARQGVTHESAN